MSRFYSISSIFIAILFLSSASLAQQPGSDNDNYSHHAAKIPRNPADTGILFDEYRLEMGARAYYDGARFSGTNSGKTKAQLETESYNAIRKMENRAAFKEQSSASWQQIAGSLDGHVSGRVRGIALDPSSKTAYIATASGGIWKTNNIEAGKDIQWINLSDRLPTCNFGSIALDPKRPNVVYAGTGESQGDNYREQISSSAPAGSGIFRSLDGGLNWDTVATIALAGNVCSQIIIDPVNTDTVYIASGSSFILKSYDGGNTWKKIPVGVGVLSITIDPVNTNKLYVSGFGSIYRSTDYGETWTKCVTGLPSTGGRITIAVAPSDPNMIYASIGINTPGTYEGTAMTVRTLLGIWLSTDYGVTWKKMQQFDATKNDANTNPIGNQQEWCNSITVHPTNSKRIFVAGLNVFQSPDSGKTWSSHTNWRSDVTQGDYVHADIHHLVFSGNVLYACTDGGIARAQSGYTAWTTDLNVGISTLQFVGVDANKEFTYVTGGCQDNNTNRASVGGKEFHATIGGDGGHAWVSQEQGQIAYTTYTYNNFKQSLDSGQTWGDNQIRDIDDVTKKDLYHENSPFYTVYDCNSDGSVIAIGGNSHVWVSTAGGTDAFPNESNVAIGNSFAIHVAPADPNGSIMWAASGGNIFHSFDMGTTWVKQTSVLASTITGITSNPQNASQVYACATSGKHFFKSADSGKNFTPATNFPNIPCWAIAIHPTDGRLFIGTEKGVFWSNDGGATWNPLMTGLPYVMVTQLRVRGVNNDKLLAGTYGRGMFWLDLTTLGSKPVTSVPEFLALEPTYPNPITSNTATLGFSTKESGLATITLHDLLGRELRILEKTYFDAGNHQISFSTTGLAAGTYIILLVENGRSVSEKIIVE